jgi:glutaredoxin
MKYLFVLLGALALNAAHADSLYRWVDKEGKVHYGDKPAADALSAEQKRFSAAASVSDDDLPYNLRKAKQDFPVTLYVSKNCADTCIQARTFLNNRGIPFVEKNLASEADVEMYKKLNPANQVPSLTIGKTLLNGYESGAWNSELDIAGYPKTKPYGLRTAPAAAPTSPAPAAAPEQ